MPLRIPRRGEETAVFRPWRPPREPRDPSGKIGLRICWRILDHGATVESFGRLRNPVQREVLDADMMKNPNDSRPLEENLPGSVDSSQMPNLFTNHGNRVAVNHSSAPMQPPVTAKKTMLPMVPPEVHNNAPPKLSAPQNLSDLNNGSTGRKYQCKMCPQIFGSKADLQLHTQIHMRDAKPYKCSQCSKTFANSSYLSQHTRIHLGIKPYRCEICHRKFTQLSHLQQHIRTHTGDKPYKCRHPNCNKAFSQLSNLQSHSRCHQTDKPYKCNSCYKCFMDEASLLEHIPRHKDSKHLKTHICQFCGKSYTQETYLSKHMQKHADRLEKQGLMSSLMIGAAMNSAASIQQLQAEPLWQKALSAKVIENTLSDETGSSVAAMAAVVASTQRRSMQHNLPAHVSEHRRLNVPSHEGQVDRVNSCETNGPNTNEALSTSQSAYGTTLPTLATSKLSSAFTPIQSGVLPVSGGGSNQLNISGASRTCFPCESINFTTASSTPSLDTKPLHSSFPNQLISLRQIRSYAAMPNITGMDHPLSLKSKGPH